MGRLDDHAKRRIVELRRAGLSFRKIKKVLELDNIRVTPQAVYLFLKRKSLELGPAAGGWGGEQPWFPLQGHEAELPQSPGPRPPTLPSGAPTGGQDGKEGTQIVSVASSCQGSRQPGGPCQWDCLLGRVRLGPIQACPGAGSLFSPRRFGDRVSFRGIFLLSLAGDSGSTGALPAPGSCQTPGTPPAPTQPLPGQGQLVMPPAKNPALVAKKIVDRALLLQNKVGCWVAHQGGRAHLLQAQILHGQGLSCPSQCTCGSHGQSSFPGGCGKLQGSQDTGTRYPGYKAQP